MTSPVPVLVLHDGRRVDLDDDVVLGRAPIAPDSAPSARSVSLAVQTVSKTHALVGSDPSGVWVVDLESSNGTEVVSPTGDARRIASGVRVPVPDGHAIRVGTDTVLTLERDGIDPDRTIARPAGDPAIVPTQPGTDGRPLGRRADDVDWSAEPAPPPGRPTPPPPPSPPRAAGTVVDAPAAAPPPPPPPPSAPVVAPSPSPPVASAATPPPSAVPPSPTTIDISAARPVPQPPPPSFGSDQPSFVMPSAAANSGAATSVPAIVGLIVLALWGVVTTLRIGGALPDDVVFGDGWPIRFFTALSTDDLERFELFGIARVPSPLRWTAYVATAGTAVLAVLGLVTRNRVVRALTAVPVLLALFFLGGFLVLLMRDQFNRFSDYAEFVLPGFVLPLVGLVLSQLPSGSSPSPMPPPPDPTSAPHTPSGPPSAGPS